MTLSVDVNLQPRGSSDKPTCKARDAYSWLRGQVASNILSCFEPDMFDATGLLSSLWLERLNFLTAAATALSEELLEADQPSPTRDP